MNEMSAKYNAATEVEVLYLVGFFHINRTQRMCSMEQKWKDLLKDTKVIPSAASMEQLKRIVENTSFPCVMVKLGDINTIGKIVAYIHQKKKTVMLHMDSVKGVSNEKAGFQYLKRIGVDAVITMKSQYVRMIKEAGMTAVWGTFVVDSASVSNTFQNVYSNKPDAIIVMPMTVPDEVYMKLQENIKIPILAGGLGVNRDIVEHVLNLGISSCAVTDREIYKFYEPK